MRPSDMPDFHIGTTRSWVKLGKQDVREIQVSWTVKAAHLTPPLFPAGNFMMWFPGDFVSSVFLNSWLNALSSG